MNNFTCNNPGRPEYADKVEGLRACLLEWMQEKTSKRVEAEKERALI